MNVQKKKGGGGWWRTSQEKTSDFFFFVFYIYNVRPNVEKSKVEERRTKNIFFYLSRAGYKKHVTAPSVKVIYIDATNLSWKMCTCMLQYLLQYNFSTVFCPCLWTLHSMNYNSRVVKRTPANRAFGKRTCTWKYEISIMRVKSIRSFTNRETVHINTESNT